MEDRKDNRVTTLGVVDNVRQDYKPTNTGEYLAGMVLLVVGALVAYWMYLNHKNKSPATQAKIEFSEKYANLDKRVSLNEQKTNNLETNLNQQFTALHMRLGKIEETMLLLVTSHKS